MRTKEYTKVIIIVGLILGLSLLILTNDVYAQSGSQYVEATFSSSSSNIGNAIIYLKKGFNFVNNDSSTYNWELALTAATLSAQVYTNADGKRAETLLKELGYESTYSFHFDISDFLSPVACFGYKKLGKGSNLFTVIVRGTDGELDKWTDAFDGTFNMFTESGNNVRNALIKFMTDKTGKSEEELKKDDNYFFFTGHSLGGAVANYLSIEESILKFVKSNKERIYTYTFESPHTCINLAWNNPESMSNALNYKVEGDAVTNLPPYFGSTTYGKDVNIKVSDLSDDLFNKLFTKSKEKTVDEAVSVDGHGDPWGLHDTCLGLVYILQKAEKEGKDISPAVYDKKGKSKKPSTNKKESIALNENKIEISKGEKHKLIATVTGMNKNITWTSTNKGVATVKRGVVTGKKIGTATIMAKCGKLIVKCKVTVKKNEWVYHTEKGKFRYYYDNDYVTRNRTSYLKIDIIGNELLVEGQLLRENKSKWGTNEWAVPKPEFVAGNKHIFNLSSKTRFGSTNGPDITKDSFLYLAKHYKELWGSDSTASIYIDLEDGTVCHVAWW